MLTVPEAARLAGRNPETIRRWIREGKLPAAKVGMQHVIDEQEFARVAGVGPTARATRPHVRLSETVAPYGSGAPAGAPLGIDPWLPAIVGRIVRKVDPARIVLFGSRARGEALADSDYDLLVVFDEVADRRATRIEVARALADLPVAKDVIVATTAESSGVGARPRGALYWALAEGTVVYERPG